MWGEHPLDAVGIDFLFALIGRHGAQFADLTSQQDPPVGRQLRHLVMNPQRSLLLFRTEALPGLPTLVKAIQQLQHVLLLRGRKARELSQLLTQLALLGRR